MMQSGTNPEAVQTFHLCRAGICPQEMNLYGIIQNRKFKICHFRVYYAGNE